jgi:endonuclease/exonuclease/phosphatase family metal-dependent hydrolase
MKLFTLLITAAFSVSNALAETPQTLRVLCYNIHYGQGMDGQYNIQRLADVIKAAKPDLVALQEVDVGVLRSGRVHQLQKLGEMTGLTARFGPTQHYEGGLFGNAILTRLPILDEHIQPLPYTDATPERQTYPRGALVITVQAPDGRPLRFISTHFQHNVPEDRVEEARAINKLFADPADKLRTILAGDFNAKPEDEPITMLEQSWTHAIDTARAPSAPSVNPKSRIDYIFYRAKNQFRLVSSAVLPESMASDHRPVLAVLEIAQP